VLSAASASAHSIHVFAKAENGRIHGEGYMGGGKKVVAGTIRILDNDTREVLLTTHLDEHGTFSFPVSQVHREPPADLLIILDGGPGHQSTWLLKSETYVPASAVAQTPEAAETPTETPPVEPNQAPSATPPLINIFAGLACIFGIGAIISLILSKKRGKK